MRALRDLRLFHDDEVREMRANMEEGYLKIEETLCLLEPKRWQLTAGQVPGFFEARPRTLIHLKPSLWDELDEVSVTKR